MVLQDSKSLMEGQNPIYGAKTWPLKQTSTKKLEAAHSASSVVLQDSKSLMEGQNLA